ncbi:Zinc finger, MIZ-type [Artemisia annua]|uniref:Zinc finger, MIZ-type n=1 Tax=Artemisia annua TaxID=35608 RepID=A0A2U1L9T8_ARTAN|nr:Zinc finger, MIZ-type [Artemisia annua]
MVLMISVKSACTTGWFSETAKEELHALSDEMQRSFCSVNVEDMNSHMKNKESNHLSTISTIMSRFMYIGLMCKALVRKYINLHWKKFTFRFYPGMKMGEIFALVETKPGYDSYVTDLHISKNARTSPGDKIYLFVAQVDNIETSSCIISPQQVNFLLNGDGVEKRTCVQKEAGPQLPTPVTNMLKYGSNLLQVVGQFTGRYIVAIAFMSVISNPTFPTLPDYIPPVAASPDPDNEIIEGPSRVSLKCPISYSRIRIPVKGHSCKHLQCFDFNNYVEINSRRPNWRCPHCWQSVSFHDIRIDQSMVKVLKEVGEDISYVKISNDGSWESVTESQENPEKPKDAPSSNQETYVQDVDDIMDLTENDNEVDKAEKDIDKKPSPAGESSAVNKNTAPHMEDGFWTEFYSTGLPGTRMNNSRSDVSEVVQRNQQMFNSITLGQTQSQSQIPVSNNMQQQQNDNSNNNGNLYTRYQNWVTRTPNAVQALPAQGSATVANGDRQQHLSRPQLNQHQVSRMMSSQGQRDHPVPILPSPQHISNGRHIPSAHFNPYQQHSMNQRPTSYPVRSPAHLSPQIRPVGPMTSSQNPQYSMADIHRATFQATSQASSIPPSIPAPGQSVTVASTGDQRGGSVDGSGEENWRPTGRMRGSLSGRAYSETLNQNIIRPNQPVQAARPPPSVNTPRPFIPPHLQNLMPNNIRSQAPQTGGSGPGSESSMAGSTAPTDVLPDK